jgi:hypothetical protein
MASAYFVALFHALWLWPTYVVSQVLNSLWYGDIAKGAWALAEGDRKRARGTAGGVTGEVAGGVRGGVVGAAGAGDGGGRGVKSGGGGKNGGGGGGGGGGTSVFKTVAAVRRCRLTPG